MNSLTFSDWPEVTFATNVFVGVPIILKYEDTALIEVVRHQQAGFTTQIPIYHADGTYLAKVVGSQIYPTEDGKRAGLSLKYPKDMTVCEQNGRVVFEIHRSGAAALKLQADLYAPDGAFVRCAHDAFPKMVVADRDKPLKVSGVTFHGNTFRNFPIAIWIRGGEIMIGVNG